MAFLTKMTMGRHIFSLGIPLKLLLPGFFLMAAPGIFAQAFDPKILEGRVYSSDGDVAAVHVLNTTTQKASITDIDGYFSIAVHLNDTLVFSAVQYQKKTLVVSVEVMESKFISVALEAANIVLDEVVVTPYNLTGELGRDMGRLNVGTPITATSIGLPNVYVKLPTQAERKLFEATSGMGFIPLNPIINGISGRTKQLKELVAVEKKYARTERVRQFYADSLWIKELKIPENRLHDFLYFCEVDPAFTTVVDTADKLKIWNYLSLRSTEYRKNNGLE